MQFDKKSGFRYLVSNERVERIIEQANFYGSDNGITRGLIFCSRKEEAKELSILFNKRGYRTIALTGDSAEEERANSIKKLDDNISDMTGNIERDLVSIADIWNGIQKIEDANHRIELRNENKRKLQEFIKKL